MSRGAPHSWLRTWNVDEIKALVWNHAHRHVAHFVDPRRLKKKELYAYISTHLADIAEPTEAQWLAMEAAFQAVTDRSMLNLALRQH